MTDSTVAAPADCTLDALLGGRVRLRQPRHGFRAAIDSVVLAASVPATAGETVAELGIGAGAAALCLARRVAGCRVVGLDLQPHLAALAAENAALNRLEVKTLCGDVRLLPPALSGRRFDHVMMNPPHFAAGSADAPRDAAKAIAHVEGDAAIADWVRAALSLLRHNGSLTIVHRADRLDAILAALVGRAGAIVVFPLWPDASGKPAKRVILHARAGSKAPLRLAAGLVLHHPDGRFTDAAESVLRHGAALVL